MRASTISALSVLAVVGAFLCPAHDGPEHQPKHGGIVFSSGNLDVEVVLLKPKGRYQIYFNDASDEELPASVANDVVLSIKRATGAPENLPLRIDDAGESWIGNGSQTDAPITGAWLAYRFRGKSERTEIPFSSVYHAEFSVLPRIAKAGEPVQLVFTVKDFFGKSVRSLQIVHEKPMHLMVVSSDLADFSHIHPEPQPGNVFRVAHVFRNGGDFRLYADFTPIGAGNRIEAFSLKVLGAPRAAISLQPAAAMTTLDGMRMTMTTDKPLRIGEDIAFSMALTDAGSGAPIRNLQRYLGAWAHIAIISQDLQDFIHVHPFEEPAPPSTIRTATGFRRPGLYKMWVQVQRDNRVTSMPFVFRVAGAGGSTPITQAVPSGAVFIRVGSGGYEPARVNAKAGQALKLAFYRADAQNCGRVVNFPTLGIQRELPPGQTVVVEVTPRKSGVFAFSCGMNMMRGELVVQ
jgi:hypothetical protein